MTTSARATSLASPSYNCAIQITDGLILGDITLRCPSATDLKQTNGSSNSGDSEYATLLSETEHGPGAGAGSATGKKAVELKFLSVVESARVPLHLVAGRPWIVETGSESVLEWFQGLLFGAGSDASRAGEEWWRNEAACAVGAESPLGVLVGVKQQDHGSAKSKVRVTEVLFYACATSSSPELQNEDRTQEDTHSPTPSFVLYGLPLSSDFIYNRDTDLTPPASPPAQTSSTGTQEIRATFLPQPTPKETKNIKSANSEEVIHTLQPRKRKTVSDTFDQATERRQKARRKGGEGVSAAAAANTSNINDSLPGLRERRTGSGSQSQALHHGLVQTRPLSRSPSLSGGSFSAAALQPGTTGVGGTAAQKRSSSLSQVTVQGETPSAAQTQEARNKELVSRLVMAGMRLWGLSQSKTRPTTASSKARVGVGVSSPALDGSTTGQEQSLQQQQQHDEYKLVYHQVFRGVCFAFRAHMTSSALGLRADALREVADRLLTLFCSDPLQNGFLGSDGGAGAVGLGVGVGGEDVTPGGRKAFGSITKKEVEKESPFGVRRAMTGAMEAETPSFKRRGADGVK